MISKVIPKVNIKYFKNYHRHDVLNHLEGNDNIGIELGVAGGYYSKQMVESKKFKRVYGVDLYEDHHDTNEYISALNLIGIEKNYTLLRMSFDNAINLFDNNFFDFIYFDGYAHTGEEGGKTFSEWYKKLKIGGIFAGDDYHDNWPLVKWAVNDMVSKLNCELNVTGIIENTHQNKYPTWFFTKKDNTEFSVNKKLKNLGLAIRDATKNNTSISMLEIQSLCQYYNIPLSDSNS